MSEECFVALYVGALYPFVALGQWVIYKFANSSGRAIEVAAQITRVYDDSSVDLEVFRQGAPHMFHRVTSGDGEGQWRFALPEEAASQVAK